MSLPSNGLTGAPCIKGIMACTAISSLLSMKGGLNSAAFLSRTPLTAASKFFAFNQPTELIIGLFMLYHFRILERNLGSAKFASYTFVTCLTALVLTRLSSRLTSSSSSSSSIQGNSFNFSASGVGPFWILFSFLAQFAATVPSSSWFDVLGLKLGDKAFTFISALTLLLATGRNTFIAGVLGLASGFLYRANLFNMQRFRLPSFIVKLFSSTIGRLLHDPPLSSSDPRSRGIRAQGRTSTGGGGQRSPRSPGRGGGGNPHGSVGNQRMEPTPEAIARLVEMGFESSRAEQALRNTNNDVDSALQLLLDG